MYENFEHHGRSVWAKSDLRGRHRQHCLCWNCEKLKPGLAENCNIAQENYALCVKYGLVNCVYECPEFVEKQ